MNIFKASLPLPTITLMICLSLGYPSSLWGQVNTDTDILTFVVNGLDAGQIIQSPQIDASSDPSDVTFTLRGDVNPEMVEVIFTTVNSAATAGYLEGGEQYVPLSANMDGSFTYSGDFRSPVEIRISHGGDTKVWVLILQIQSFEAPTPLSGGGRNNIAPGDFDGDGLHDLIITGTAGDGTAQAIFYRGTGSGFTASATTIPATRNGTVDAEDIDGDTDLDILVTGVDQDGGMVAAIYENSSGVFTELESGDDALIGVSESAAAFADIDNDGDLDIAISGNRASGGVPQPSMELYRNTESGFEVIEGHGISALFQGSIEFGDYDRDGYQDLLISGSRSDGTPETSLYRNLGEGVFERSSESQVLPDVKRGQAGWLDFDQDGDLDVLVTGMTAGESSKISMVCSNRNGRFSRATYIQVADAFDSSFAAADFNSDGNPDFIIQGDEGTAETSDPRTRVYVGTDFGSFTQTDEPLINPFSQGSLSWVDLEGDGDLDVVITGLSAGSWSAQLYRVATPDGTANTPPGAPSNLRARLNEGRDQILFAWDDPTVADEQTSSRALGFDLYVGTTSGSYELSPSRYGTNSGNVYRLAPTRGSLQTNFHRLGDLTSSTTYYWSVQTVDGGLLASDLAIESSIVVTDQNPLSVTFVPSSPQTSEDAVAGTVVGVFSTTDNFGAVATYHLVIDELGTTGGSEFFEIEGANLKVKEALDYEAYPSGYTINVQSVNELGGSLVESFTISVSDINENPTYIQLNQSQSQIPSNVEVGAVIGSFSSTDPEDSVFTYELDMTFGQYSYFRIENANDLAVASTLDHTLFSGEYAIRVTSSDGNGGSLTREFQINVAPPNNPPSSLDLTLIAGSIPENTPVNSAIGTLVGSDPDPGTQLFFRLTLADDGVNDFFGITPPDQLILIRELDFETSPSIQVEISVVDGSGGVLTRTFQIEVGDSQDPPSLISLTLENEILPEDLPVGTLIGTLTSEDPDGDTIFSYGLDPAESDNACFRISGNEVFTLKQLDYELHEAGYTLRISSTDSSMLTLEVEFTIQVSDVDEAPVGLTLSLSGSLSESDPVDTLVGILSAKNPDGGTNFSYTLDSAAEADGFFTIRGDELLVASALDYESYTAGYPVTISVRDSESGVFAREFVLVIGDDNDPPDSIILTLVGPGLQEQTPAGTLVGTLEATDQDVADVSFSFSLVDLTGSGSFFEIVGSELRTAREIVYEGYTEGHVLKIMAEDTSGGQFSETFTIRVFPINDPPSDLTFTPAQVSFPENTPEGTSVGTFASVDPDGELNFTYELDNTKADNAYFVIQDGNVLTTASALDYESSLGEYAIEVTTYDRYEESLTRNFVIAVTDVNDPPTDILLTLDTTPVDENTAVGSRIGTLDAIDEDDDSFTFEITGEDSGSSAFRIVAMNVIEIAEALDFESHIGGYVLTVRVTDSQMASYTREVVIPVGDANDPPQNFELTLVGGEVGENTELGTQIGTFSATDPNGSPLITFSLVENLADNSYFQVGTAGELLVAAVLDYETHVLGFQLIARAEDDAGAGVTQNFVVPLRDENDAPTSISLILDGVPLVEGIPVLSRVGTLHATDPDGDVSFVYSMPVGESDNAYFSVDSDGIILTAQELDYEGRDGLYTLSLVVMDAQGASYAQTLTLTIRDANEAPEGFTFVPSAPSFPEDTPVGTILGQLSATDDSSTSESLHFKLILGANDNETFALTLDGNLTLALPFDFETHESGYVVDVTVKDQNGGRLVERIIIEVTDVNDPPRGIRFEPSVDSLSETMPAGTEIGVLSAGDDDGDDPITIELVENVDDNMSFEVQPPNRLVTRTALDYESHTMGYSLMFRLTDPLGASSEEGFTINILDANEPPTRIVMDPFPITVARGLGIDSIVARFTTDDPDLGDSNIQFTYSLVPGPGSSGNQRFYFMGSTLRNTAEISDPAGSEYLLRVRSEDDEGAFIESNLVATVVGEAVIGEVNLRPTSIVLSSTAIASMARAGMVVGTLTTIDPDAQDTHTYTLVEGNGSADNLLFTVEGNTLVVAQDIETSDRYIYNIRLQTDDGGVGGVFSAEFSLQVQGELSTGSREGMRVIPSPASDQVLISFPRVASYEVEITDSLGRTVFSGRYPKTSRINVSLTGFVSGSYVVHATGATGEAWTGRLVVH